MGIRDENGKIARDLWRHRPGPVLLAEAWKTESPLMTQDSMSGSLPRTKRAHVVRARRGSLILR